MRNLAQHPVTKDEIIQGLTRLQKNELDKGSFGNITPLLLRMAIEIVEKHGDEVVQQHVSKMTEMLATQQGTV